VLMLEMVDLKKKLEKKEFKKKMPALDLRVSELQRACKEKGILFLKGLATPRPAKNPRMPEVKPSGKAAQAMTVTINNRAYGVEFSSPNSVSVNGITYALNVKEGLDSEAIARTVTLPKSDDSAGVSEIRSIDSPLSGFVSKMNKKNGDKVAIGETVLIVETMGMSVPVNASLSGVIVEMLASRGEPIEQGQGIARISTLSHGSKKTVSHARDSTTRAVGDKTALVSPSAGIVLKIYKNPGEMVRIGESILVLEAMKMETPISSTQDGLVDRILVRLGDQVKAGQNLVLLSPGEET